jgi:hypothetical protein
MLKKISLLLLALLLFLPAASFAKENPDDDLSPLKMESAARKFLDSFVKGTTNSLKRYISEDWIDENNIKMSRYTLNSYSPESYEILFNTSNVVVAVIKGESWAHLMMFKFADEGGTYRLIPKGISTVSSEYIDPWWDVVEYFKVPQEVDSLDEPPPPKED